MKKLILTIAIVFGIMTAHSQLYYTGPKNTQELTDKLNDVNFPILFNLSEDTKNALITLSIFDDNKFRGFSDYSPFIQELYNTNFKEVISSICNGEVVVYKLNIDGSGKPNVEGCPTGMSHCCNCQAPGPRRDGDHCCRPDGDGCCDIINPVAGLDQN